MKTIVKGIIGLSASVFMVVAVAESASACTGVYIGKDVSEDGTTILARSVDYVNGKLTYIDHIDRQTHEEGDSFVEPDTGFTYVYPENTYAYTIIKNMDMAEEYITTDCTTNEYGLTVTGTITAYTNEAALKADPFVEDGIGEESISLVLGSSCKTAASAVKYLAKLIDEYGSNDANIIMLSDQYECWYMEIYTGHQYAAVKMPDDKVACFGNLFMLHDIDVDSKDVVVSENLVKLAEDEGFAAYCEDGSFDLVDTYADHCDSHRNYAGMVLLAPSKAGEYSEDRHFPLFYEPDEKVSLEDVFALYRNRYENITINTEGDRFIYPIGSETTNEVHVVQTYDNVPAEISNVIWYCDGATSFAPFVPISGYANDISDTYSTNLSEDKYVEGNAACELIKLNTICKTNVKELGSDVREYWEGLESHYIAEVSAKMSEEWPDAYASEPEEAATLISDYSNTIMEQVTDKAHEFVEDLSWLQTKEIVSMPLFSEGSAKEQFAQTGAIQYEAEFDVEEYANSLGWETTVQDGVLTATRGDKVITIELEDLDNIDEDTAEVVFEIEEVPEDEYGAKASTVNKESKSLNKAEDSIDDYFKKKLSDIPAEGLTDREALEQLLQIKDELIKLIAASLGKSSDEIELADIEAFINSDIYDESNVDPERLRSLLLNISSDSTELIEQYFGLNIEDIAAKVSTGEMTQEEIEDIINGIGEDIHDLFIGYINWKLEDVLNNELSEEQIDAILTEAGNRALNLIMEYTGISPEYLEGGQIDLSDISMDDFVDAIDSLDDETKKGLGELFGVDVDETIEAYRSGDLEVNIDIEVDDEYVPDVVLDYFGVDKNGNAVNQEGQDKISEMEEADEVEESEDIEDAEETKETATENVAEDEASVNETTEVEEEADQAEVEADQPDGASDEIVEDEISEDEIPEEVVAVLTEAMEEAAAESEATEEVAESEEEVAEPAEEILVDEAAEDEDDIPEEVIEVLTEAIEEAAEESEATEEVDEISEDEIPEEVIAVLTEAIEEAAAESEATEEAVQPEDEAAVEESVEEKTEDSQEGKIEAPSEDEDKTSEEAQEEELVKEKDNLQEEIDGNVVIKDKSTNEEQSVSIRVYKKGGKIYAPASLMKYFK